MDEIELFDLVFLRENIHTPPLIKGTLGTIIHIYKPQKIFEVEFLTKDGETLASIVLEHWQIEKLGLNEFNLIEEVTFFKVRV